MRKQLLFFSFVLVFSAALSRAATLPAPSNKIDYETYENLVKQKVLEVPDLAALWNWRQQNPQSPVYFGGGAFRGLLLWIHQRLAESDVQTVMKTRPPNVDGLLIQKDSDRDIYTQTAVKDQFLKWTPYAQWDVLTEEFYLQTIENKGTAIDKVRANPGEIGDPLGGLREFYKGQLSFNGDAPPFKESYGGTVLGDTWLGLALRFIRIARDLAAAADPSDEAVRAIQTFAKEKPGWIPESLASDLTWPKNYSREEWASFRIRKALDKLYKATRNKPGQFVRILQEYGLLELVSRKNYNVVSMTQSDFKNLADLYRNERLSFEELAFLARMQSSTVDAADFSQQVLFYRVKTVEDMRLALRPMRENTSDEYKNRLNSLYLKFAAEQPELVAQALTPELLDVIAVATSRIDSLIVLKRLAMGKALTVTEGLRFLNAKTENINDNYKAQLRNLLIEQFAVLRSRIQSVDDVFELERAISNVPEMVELKKSFVARTQSAAEVLRLIRPVFENPSVAYVQSLQELARQTTATFLSRNPSDSEILEYASLTNDPLPLELKLIENEKSIAKFNERLRELKPKFAGIDMTRKEMLLASLVPAMKRLGFSHVNYNVTRDTMGLSMVGDANSPFRHTSWGPSVSRCEALL